MRTVGNGEKGITPGKKRCNGQLQLPLVMGKKPLPPVEKGMMVGFGYRW